MLKGVADPGGNPLCTAKNGLENDTMTLLLRMQIIRSAPWFRGRCCSAQLGSPGRFGTVYCISTRILVLGSCHRAITSRDSELGSRHVPWGRRARCVHGAPTCAQRRRRALAVGEEGGAVVGWQHVFSVTARNAACGKPPTLTSCRAHFGARPTWAHQERILALSRGFDACWAQRWHVRWTCPAAVPCSAAVVTGGAATRRAVISASRGGVRPRRRQRDVDREADRERAGARTARRRPRDVAFPWHSHVRPSGRCAAVAVSNEHGLGCPLLCSKGRLIGMEGNARSGIGRAGICRPEDQRISAFPAAAV